MIIKNLLPDSYKNELKELIGSDFFPWYWNNYTIHETYKNEIFYQFTHTFFDLIRNDGASQFFTKILPIIYFFEKETGFKIKGINKIKANLLTQFDKTDDEIKTSMHRDVGALDIKDISKNDEYKNYISFIYYVIDSDGDTIICDNDLNEIERASPIANNLVWFKSILPHYATPPKTNKRRIIINFVVELEQ